MSRTETATLTMVFIAVILASILLSIPPVHSFAIITPRASAAPALTTSAVVTLPPRTSRIASTDNGSNENDDGDGAKLSDSDATSLGLVGKIASVVMLYSESVLYRTGCGLPAGPLGLVGAAEGLSYLSVLGLVAFSLFTKITTGKGLPEGPGKILGAAEGLAYVAVLAGIFVLFAQVTNYGYIPNAVPMEGGMCS